MTRTREEIRTMVQYHTGRTDKTTLINELCDSALKYAVMEHDFTRNFTRTSSETEITTNATEIDLSGYSPTVYKIITAKILDTNDEQSAFLPLRDSQWWDRFVINAEDNTGGWPTNGMHELDKLLFDRPCESDKKLRLLYTTIPTFTQDSTTCPVPTLDLFVEYWVTANVFFSISDMEKFGWWNKRAIGNDPTNPGGELKRAIRADEREAAKVREAIKSGGGKMGIVTNDLDWDGASEHNQIRSWY